MNSEIGKILLNSLLVLFGSVSAGMATYHVTGDPIVGIFTFGAAIGLVGAMV